MNHKHTRIIIVKSLKRLFEYKACENASVPRFNVNLELVIPTALGEGLLHAFRRRGQ